jgi:DNA-binding LytR/AlgR family response regulator
MTLNCFIIEDEPIARKVLEEYIEETEYLSLAGSADNPIKAMPLIKKSRLHLLFLDINMPQMSGYEFIKSYKDLPPVIITTAYSQYAVEGYELNVLDYLVKPISFERFEQACAKARKLHDSSSTNVIKAATDHFFVRNNNILEKVYYNELLYVEAKMNYVLLHTVSQKLIVYITIKSMMEQLPEQLFVKVHKSFIVNSEKIKSIEGNTLSIGKEKIIISQNLRDEVFKKIINGKLIKR